MNDYLRTLAKKYKVDKHGKYAITSEGSVKLTAGRDYIREIYTPLFSDFKEQPIHLLEIGVGKHGASLKMWKDYFNNGNIYCFDGFFCYDHEISPEDLEQIGVRTVKGNQLVREDLLKMAALAPPDGFDFIIDDASHAPDAIQITMGTLFPYLKNGGLFIIEDLDCCIRDAGNSNPQLLNNWLDSHATIEDDLPRHVKDYDLEAALINFENTGEWISETLTNSECEYLANNIKEWTWGTKWQPQSICVIKKGERNNG